MDPRFIQTVRSDQGPIVHQHTWPLNARLYYFLQSIDKYGRKSPFTHEIMIRVPWSPWLFVSDSANHRVKQHLRSDLSYEAKFGSYGTGADNFNYPFGLAADHYFLYIADQLNSRLKKHRRLDFSLDRTIGTQGSGDDQFYYPRDCDIDDVYVYVTDTENHRIKKHLKSDLSFVAAFGSQGSGDNQFYYPRRITTQQRFS